MPKLKLTLNIGKADATRLGLKETEADKEVDVADEPAGELLRNGWAVEPGQAEEEEAAPGLTPADLARGTAAIQFSGPEADPPAAKAERRAKATEEKKRRGRPPKSGGSARFGDNPHK
jgi:hypothetical protein